MIPLPFAFSPSKAIAIGAIVVAFIGVLGLAYVVREAGAHAQAQRDAPIISGLTGDLAACKATLAQQADALSTQNVAIDRLQTEGEERSRAADAAIRKAQQEARAYKAKAERIARAKPGPDQCASARGLIVDTLSEER